VPDDCRGASTPAELERQRAKLVAALAGLAADVVGLIELENDGGAALADLVDALGAAVGAPVGAAVGEGSYRALDTGRIGGDAITVGIAYRRAAVVPVGDPAILDDRGDPRFDARRNRPVLAQTFRDLGTGTEFTVAVAHLRSKRSPCPGDPDLGDGQGNCPRTRTLAAAALAEWLATRPTGTTSDLALIVGDLNAYSQEDPLTLLRDAGYVDLLARSAGPEASSFGFGGQWGRLDHALASPHLAPFVTGAATWAINADEPAVLGFTTSFKSPEQLDTLYVADPFRSSDHDPVLVGIALPTASHGTLAPRSGR
jgi:uncharacterized protein